jgi:hypothetical protein
VSGSLGMGHEIGLALRRERLAEADRDRRTREAERRSNPLLALVMHAVRQWIKPAMSGARADWRHDLAARLAIGSALTPR